MPRHISLIFPGQGSQSIGMLDDFSSKFINKHTVDIKSAIGFDLIKQSAKVNKNSLIKPQ